MERQRAFVRRDVRFGARDGTRLGGWLYLTERTERPSPCVIMSHGFTALIEHGIAPHAEALAAAGFSVLVYDHRGYGRSEGEPRRETDPFRQMHDMRDAVTYATTLHEVDETRIGAWGSSYSGGHVLVLGAVDRRVKCVVSLVPHVSGSELIHRLAGEANLQVRYARTNAARKAEMSGAGIQYQPHTAAQETLDWFAEVDAAGLWKNEVSTISHDMVMEYEPGDYIHRIAPTPLLMIVTDRDTRCGTELQLEAYSRARHPKRLLMIRGGHYDVYSKRFDQVSGAAREWFSEHLRP